MSTNPDDHISIGTLTEANGKGHMILGLTKREHFAALALQALINTLDDAHSWVDISHAVVYADGLIEALNAPHKPNSDINT